jgi:hypothetical protein
MRNVVQGRQDIKVREAIRSASAVFVALSKNLPHDIRDDGRQVPRQTIDIEVDAFDLSVQAVDLVLQAIEFVLQAIHPGLDGGQSSPLCRV